MTTEAPGSGAPCSSVTLPVTVFCCANAGAANEEHSHQHGEYSCFHDEVYRVLVDTESDLIPDHASACGAAIRARQVPRRRTVGRGGVTPP